MIGAIVGGGPGFVTIEGTLGGDADGSTTGTLWGDVTGFTYGTCWGDVKGLVIGMVTEGNFLPTGLLDEGGAMVPIGRTALTEGTFVGRLRCGAVKMG